MIGRFAPSPSGRMHLGNVFAALLAWLAVRSAGGELLLRIEDLDPRRCREEYAQRLREDLKLLGLDWDKEQTPQSQRGQAYARAFSRLEDMGLVYPCYCSRAELHAASAPHASDGQPVYAGVCRSLSPEERAARTKAPAWRLRAEGEYSFTDGLQGFVSETLAETCGDFIIRRADGVHAYQLAVVCDDMAGGVTQVVRGRDLLSSTPRQLYLYELLGGTAPSFCHVPLLIDETGRRLSKRDGDLDLSVLLEKHTPRELTGRLAWAAGLLDRCEPASPEELVPLFRWDRVKREDIVIRKHL